MNLSLGLTHAPAAGAFMAPLCVHPVRQAAMTDKTKYSQIQTFKHGKRSATASDGTTRTAPELVIQIANTPKGWVWAINIHMGSLAFGYDLKSQLALQKAVASRQTAISNACAEIAEHIHGRRVRKQVHLWLDSLAGDSNRQLALFDDSPEQQCLPGT